MTVLRKIHRFFVNHSLYPLLLATSLALGFYSVRVLLARNWNYLNLVWNLFLAWVPYGFSLAAAGLHKLLPKSGWLLLLPGALWLLFYPNAPYIVTDFYHLEYRPPLPMWYDIGLIAIFAFTGCFLAIASLRTMQMLVKAYLGGLVSWLFALMVIALGGLGIYLGRFGRFNSWDFIFHPLAVGKELTLDLLNVADGLRFVGFTLMFTTILLVFYLMFVSINRLDEPPL